MASDSTGINVINVIRNKDTAVSYGRICVKYVKIIVSPESVISNG